ncbi:hypothetical protein GCM10011331_15060 [Flavimobilis marinus]|nr:hypothetical protein GCM10011331_15060 [Flavimobilis marinus]
MSEWLDHSWAGITERCVKYIAKSPAKNMSSLASHTMVPTDTGFGRFTLACVGVLVAAVAVVTRAIMAELTAVRGQRPMPRVAVCITIAVTVDREPQNHAGAAGFRHSLMTASPIMSVRTRVVSPPSSGA